jgi:hypothetical protein
VTTDWTLKDTTTHQDHVIAHVVGATLLGYFQFDEVLYILLNIGFIWSIFLDGEMGLLPHPVAINELDVPAAEKSEIKSDIDALLADGHAPELMRLSPAPVECLIREVSFFAHEEARRLLIVGEQGNVIIETALDTGGIQVYGS